MILFHGVAVLWSVSLDLLFLCVCLLLCGRSVIIVESLPRSDLRFPLTTGSPCGTSQCLRVFGSIVLSLCVFFGRGVVGCCPLFHPCLCLLGVPLVEVCFSFFLREVPSGSSAIRDVAVSSLIAHSIRGAYASLIFLSAGQSSRFWSP